MVWGDGSGVYVAIKNNIREACDDGKVLYLDYLNVSMLVVTLYCGLQEVNIVRKWVIVRSLYYFLQLHVNLPK